MRKGEAKRARLKSLRCIVPVPSLMGPAKVISTPADQAMS